MNMSSSAKRVPSDGERFCLQGGMVFVSFMTAYMLVNTFTWYQETLLLLIAFGFFIVGILLLYDLQPTFHELLRIKEWRMKRFTVLVRMYKKSSSALS